MTSRARRVDPSTLISDLPVATRQMVEIAKVLGANARIVIFDEPTTSLSEEDARHLLALINRIKREDGVSVLYVTHRLEEIFEIGDRITVLRDGQLITTGATREFTHDTLIRSMVGRQISALYPERDHKNFDKVVLSVQGLHLTGSPYPIDLEVHAGEILGLGGLVGAGRTETVRAIFGADPMDAGTVTIDDKRLHPGSPGEAVRLGLGLLTEDRKDLGILADLSIRENVTIADLAEVSRLNFISKGKEVSLVRQLVLRLRLKYHSTEQTISSLSGGNQQKVLFSRWLARKARVLLLDEPTKGVDVGAKADIYTIIGDLAASGLGILVLLIFIAGLILTTNDFLTLTNLDNLVRQVAVFAILSVGQLFVILTGGIDLSVGSVLGLSGGVTALMLSAGVPVPIAVLAGLIVGLVVGLINGLIVSKMGLPPFIATLGMLGIARGIVLLLTRARTIAPLPDSFITIANGFILGLPSLFWILVIVAVIAAFILGRTIFGRYVYAVGSNAESARLSGVPVNYVLIAVYSISGLLAGFAGVLTTSRLGAGIPTAGTGYELQAIAGAVIGGASLSGAKGRIIGAVLGALIMAILANGGNLLGVDPFYLQIAIGLLIILAVYFDHLQGNSVNLMRRAG